MPTAVFADEEKPVLTGDAKKAHDRALAQFHVSASFFTQQRERELSDLKFVDFDEMWPPDAKAQRQGQQAGGAGQGLPPTPPRPSIVINLLRAPISVVANTRRQARLSLDFAPKGEGAAQDTADAYEDIARGIQQESRASIARNWAGDRADKCGMGWYRLDTEYVLDNPDPKDPAWNDQQVVYRRILNQASVYPDPFAQEPDFCDGKDLFITEDLPFLSYKALYGDSALAKADDGAEGNGAELSAIGDKLPSWVFSAEGDQNAGKTVRVAEHWEVKEEVVTLKVGTRSRKLRRRSVWWSKINAIEYLEAPRETDWTYIPIIPVIAEEFNVNGERRWQGMVRPSRDACLAYCVQRAAQIETIGLATKAPYIGYMETIEPYLEWWKQSATRNYFMLPVSAAKSRAPDGSLLPMPTRTVQEPAIQAITIAANAAKDDVQMTTLVPPAALGALDPHDRSGKAIQALQGQAELATSGYLGNLSDISMAYEGKCLRGIIPKIYDRPGRILQAIDKKENKRQIMINQPFTTDPKSGHPVPVPGWQPGMPIPEGAQYVDLSAGEYSVAPVVGKSYQTQREAENAAIGNVLQVTQGTPLGLALIPAYIGSLDTPNAKKMEEIAVKALPPEMQTIYQDSGQELPPEQAKILLQQLQTQNQKLEQALQTKQPELANKMQIAQMQEQAGLQKAQMDNQTAMQKAELQATATMSAAQAKVDAENFRSYVDALETRLGHSLDLHMSKVSEHLGRIHEATMQALDQAHAHRLSAQEHVQTLEQQRQAHQQTMQQTAQAAALAPEPTDGGNDQA